MKLIFMNDIGVNRDSANLMSFDMLKELYDYEVWDLSEIYHVRGMVVNIPEAVPVATLEEFETRLGEAVAAGQVVIMSNMVERAWRRLAPIAKKYGVPIVNTQKNNFTEILDRKIAFSPSIKVGFKSRVRRLVQSIGPLRRLRARHRGERVTYDYQISSYNSKPETVKNFVKSHNVKYDEHLEALKSENPIGEKYILFIDGSMCYHPMDFKDGDPHFDEHHYMAQVNAYLDGIEKKTGLPVVVSLHPVSAARMTDADFGGRKTTCGMTAQLIAHAEFTISHYSTSLINVVLSKKPALILTSKEIETSLRYRWQVLGFAFAKYCDFAVDSMDSPTYKIPTVNEKKYDRFTRKYLVDTNCLDVSNSDILIQLLQDIEHITNSPKKATESV